MTRRSSIRIVLFAIAMVTIAVAVAGPGEAAAQTLWFVSPDGSDAGAGSAADPFATAQHAIDTALAGDVVVLLAGTYRGAGNRDLDFGGKALTLTSESGDPASCTIDCEGAAGTPHRGFWFHSLEDTTTVVRGVTVTGGGGFSHGGGILCGDPDQPMYSDAAGSPLLEDCVISGNAADEGAGLAIQNYRCSPVLRRVTVTGNTGEGLAIGRDVGSALLEDCTITGNEGAGLLIDGTDTGGEPPYIRVRRCDISGNQDDGIRQDTAQGVLQLEDCTLADNVGWGIRGRATFAGTIDLLRCWITGNGAGGADTYHVDSSPFTDCVVSGNQGDGILGGGFNDWPEITRTRVENNGGNGFVHALTAPSLAASRVPFSGEIIDSQFIGNGLRGIDLVALAGEYVIDGCLITGNGSDGLALAGASPAPGTRASIRHSTIASNGGAGILLSADIPCSLSVSIVADNDAAGFAVEVATIPEIACTDIHGNTGGDWTGPIADQLDAADNFSEAPGFCDAAGGDLHLLDISPCAAGNHPSGGDCDTIGALGVGCAAVPSVLSVVDVPGDQGGRVRLTWAASHLDSPAAPDPVVSYGIYRRENVPTVTAAPAAGRADKLDDWDYLETVPGRGDDIYQWVAPTLCDSTEVGVCWSVFMVSAMTANTFVYYDSPADSGYSVDNLAPAAPLNLHFPRADVLAWDPVDDDDVHLYNVYAGDSDNAAGLALFARTPADSLVVTGTGGHYFAVTATDHAGNEGHLSVITRNPTAATGALPARFALNQNFPNPFNPSTVLRYDLPAATTVVLTIYDVEGRVVRRLLEGSHESPGEHEYHWDGRDDTGRAVAAGVYVCRLRTEFGIQVRSMTLVR